MPELKKCGLHRLLHEPVPVRGNGKAEAGHDSSDCNHDKHRSAKAWPSRTEISEPCRVAKFPNKSRCLIDQQFEKGAA
jgi:hypothetical protein